MLNTDEAALICDFAESYNIFDYKVLPVKTAALLASGLRENSRIKMKLCNQKVPIETILLAAAVDRLTVLLWSNSEDGQKNRNRPKLIAPQLTGETIETEMIAFDSIEKFQKTRAELLQKKGG